MRDCDWLLEKLKENVEQMEKAGSRIKEIHALKILSDADIEELQKLHSLEFKLAMNHSGIYDDLLEALNQVDVFTKKRITKEAEKLLKTVVVYL